MTRWTVIIPVKAWALAKARLGVSNERRVELARAFSLDVLHCVVDTPQVGQIIVVTAEPELEARARTAGALILNDRPLLSGDSLNDAIRLGRSWALVNAPAEPIVVIPGDLPSLTPGALAEALEMMADCETSFVPDAEDSGTTLLSAATPQLLRPLYGAASGRRHCAHGSPPIMNVDPRVRRDVDTMFDLACALQLGVGEETGQAAHRGRSVVVC